MLKYLCIFVFLTFGSVQSVAVVGKDAVNPEKAEDFLPIVKSFAERKSDGSFIFSFEGADGSYREEVGFVYNAGTDDETIEVSGEYHYYDPDGKLIEVKYTAGKDGFIPHGTNIPEEISLAAQAAAEAARNEPKEVK